MDESPTRVLLEVCVGSVADLESAVVAGADRVELCSAPELGGLTPSIGLLERAMAISTVPVVVMLRPRCGGFCYDRHEFAAMLTDAERFLDLGASGVVFGMLDNRGRIDLRRTRELVERAGGAEVVFHRAFDFVPDQRAALDELIQSGCRRVLTSGGRATAKEGASTIRKLICQASGRIEVLPGGGIRPENIVELIRHTGCTGVHIGAGVAGEDGSIKTHRSIELNDARFVLGYAHRVVDTAAIAATIAALRRESVGP